MGQTLPNDTSAQANVLNVLPSWQSRILPFHPVGDVHSTLNEIGSLLSDNPHYYGRAPIWLPFLKSTFSNAVIWAIDRYVFNYDYSHIGLASWRLNLQRGWRWSDNDRISTDWFFHPYSGGGYYMDARSLGYNFWESIPFVAAAEVEWKYFGETDQPCISDLITTTVGGPFVGEVDYRLTSNILDDSKTGFDRLWREVAVAFLSPSRFLSRLITGELWRVAPQQELEREPWDVELDLGAHRVNNGTSFNTGPVKASMDIAVAYGDPFEVRDRKPFDQFKLWTEFTNAYQRKYLAEVTGYGELFAGNASSGNFHMMYGLFQHLDYFDNLTFELADLSFGPGILTKWQLTEHHSLYSEWHASFIPIGANNASFFPNPTTDQRDYSYGDGFEAMTKTGFELGDRLIDLSLIGYYVYFNSYYGQPVRNTMLLLKPHIAVRLFRNLSIGFEHQIYESNRLGTSLANPTIENTEQRLFVQWNWDDFPRE